MAGGRISPQLAKFRPESEAGVGAARPGAELGKWTVVRYLGHDRHKKDRWLCRCDCGQEHAVSGLHLRTGKSASCGCARSRPQHGHTIGGRPTPEFNSWRGMIERCSNPHHESFARYGGRGIKVCERWASFEAFLNDMGRRPRGQTLDRINPEGNYEPNNCRWATTRVQGQNTSKQRHITAGGETLRLYEWAERLGIATPVILGRLARGWSEERAVLTPKWAVKSGPARGSIQRRRAADGKFVPN